MKKLIAMLGAVAMAFGLYATDYKLSFEETEAGVDTGTWTVPDDGSKWAPAGAYTLATDGASRDLPYADDPTDPMARRTFDASTNDNYLPLETGSNELSLSIDAGNKVIDQLVKFTGFEEAQTDLAAGTKIAVWMSEFPDEDDDDVTHTNLFVTCAKVTDEGTEQVAIQIGDEGDYELDKWYRLTIKSLDNIMTTGTRGGFVVYVNGKILKSDAAKALIGKDDLTDDAKKALAKGALFPAIDATDATFASASFKGIGAIDDVYVDENGPQFKDEIDCTILPTENVVITIVDKDGNSITVTDGKFAVDPAVAPLRVTFRAADGYVMDDVVREITAEQLAEDPNFDFSDAVDPKEVVATVTDTDGTEFKYATLADALAKVQELEATESDISISISKTVAAEEILGAGTLGFDEGTLVVVNCTDPVADWVIMGNARLGADIAAGKTVIVTADEGEGLVGTLAYSGTVAGSLSATTLTKLDDDDITIAVGGEVTVGTKIAEYATFFTAPTGFQVKEEYDETEGVWTYTVEEIPPATFTVTVDASNATLLTNGFAVVDAEFTAEAGTVFALTAEAATGYKSATIKIDNVDVTDLTLEKDVTIVVGATAKAYVLNATEHENTKLTKDPEQDTYALNDVVTLTAALADGDFEWDNIPDGWISTDGNVTYTLTYTIVDGDETEGNVVATPTAKAKSTDPIDDPGSLTPTGKDNVDTLKAALALAGGNIDTYAAKIYAGGKIPAAQLNGTTPALIAVSVAYDLPIVKQMPTVTVAAAESTAGAPAFQFTVAADVDIDLAKAAFQKIVKYSADLATDEFDASTAAEVNITTTPGSNVMTAEFVKGPAKGFMKADFTVAE